MFGKMKKLIRGSKGMEALQSVLLLGAGFVVVWGLMTVWEKTAKPAAEKTLKSTVEGTNGSDK